ncbi:acetoin utilization protein AcuC [Humibacillus xanthopallidus]|uniref:Acetoin utilization protein AcuC n=1 Tax=Humibacillus xanthopallidus TaxID=412689 RepID=A0A543PMX5_9MICO|nr:acetoin utilization protein AcuC [Humibacillus xanthopallidus]TQN45409.1 acetoin utilization protein AcuC [Humibacillus xanthopallidus]
MPSQARVVWDTEFTRYDFGPMHPMAPIRLDLTARLCEALGVLDAPGVEVVGAEVASDEVLETVHNADYVAAVRAASVDPGSADPAYGLGTEDDPAFLGMHDASARVVTGTLESCQAVWTGEAEHAVNFCGGLHHAMPGAASGFCVYNDAAVGIRWLLANGAKRVAYVDLDVHHGDGVERIFWDDPRVLTISVHESGRALFPGTGWPTDIGGPDAEGDAVNVSLPPGLPDAGWLRAIHATVPALVRSFKPDVLVTQHGCDTHVEDPLAHFAVSVDAQRAAAEAMHRLAHDVCGGRWVALGGGGYEVVDVVPRTWTHLTAIAAHVPVKTSADVPQDWRDHVEQVTGRPGPRRMGDLTTEDGPLWWRSWEMGYDPASEIDRAIMATRSAVFPLHGLDVHFD